MTATLTFEGIPMPFLSQTTLRVGDHRSCCISSIIGYADKVAADPRTKLPERLIAVPDGKAIYCESCRTRLVLDGNQWFPRPE